MPRRTVLSLAEREGLFVLPDNQNDLIQQYTFSESDLSIIRQHRGEANRLGFAVQLCYNALPGYHFKHSRKAFLATGKFRCRSAKNIYQGMG